METNVNERRCSLSDMMSEVVIEEEKSKSRCIYVPGTVLCLCLWSGCDGEQQVPPPKNNILVSGQCRRMCL